MGQCVRGAFEANCLAPDHPDFPASVREAFGRRAPQLQVLGAQELLSRPGIGICGSRRASGNGIAAAEDCAQQAVERGFVVISGNAAGVDVAVHRRALAAGGSTILVLPEGIAHFRVRSVLKPVWDWNRVLVISQFDKNAVWSVWRAMARNRLIIALSQALIAVEAGLRGGTINAARQALGAGKPVFVVNLRDMADRAPGNMELLRAGAGLLSKNKQTGRACFDRVTAQLEGGKILPERGAEQLTIL